MSTAAFPKGAAARASARLYPQPGRYINDPVSWVEKKLKEFIWSKQKEILESIRDHKQTAIASCHSAGKSHTISRAIGWWLDPEVHALGSAFCVTTAPSWPQIEAILWRYLKRVHNKAKLRGRITSECKWHMSDAGAKRLIGDATEELIAMGRKPADYDEDSFQGIHARYVLAVIDEAGGVPKQLFDAIMSVTTNDDSRVCAIGNPEDPDSYFHEICKIGSGWNVIWIPAWCTPNFTAEVCASFDRERIGEEEWVPEEVAATLLGPNWVRERAHDWGVGSPLWQGKIEAIFPEISENTLFTPAWLRKVTSNDLPGLEHGQYGCDIARNGPDKSVMYRNRGGQIRFHREWHKMDTEESANIIIYELNKHAGKRLPVVIDAIGIGAGPYDKLRHGKFNVRGFYGSEKAHNVKRFKNRRSEIYYTFKELGDDGALDLDETDQILLNELGSLRWWTDSAGRIIVEPKEDYVERLGRSPDRADAAVLSIVSRGSLREGDQTGSNSLTDDLLHKLM